MFTESDLGKCAATNNKFCLPSSESISVTSEVLHSFISPLSLSFRD